MIKKKLRLLYNDTMNELFSAGRFSKSEIAQNRLKVVEFSKKYGVKASQDAFGISRSTIFRWRRCLKDSQGRLDSLIPKSRRPRRVRSMKVNSETVAFIRDIREEHPRIGKEKIKKFLDEYCSKRGIKTVSVSTIGKVIKRYDLTFAPSKLNYHNPQSGWATRKVNYKNKVKHSPKYKEMGYIEIDTITKFIQGIKRYILNAIDISGKVQFAYEFRTLSSRNTVAFFKKLETVYPYESGIKVVQTDNGPEFRGEFDEYLKKRNIKHNFIYPRCPRVNGYIERANRTLQEEFIDLHLNLLAEDIDKFNRRLIDYLLWYNTERPHKSLNNLTPIDYLLKYYPESQMYVTCTTS
jgi:transposase-like protein